MTRAQLLSEIDRRRVRMMESIDAYMSGVFGPGVEWYVGLGRQSDENVAEFKAKAWAAIEQQLPQEEMAND